ncbi:hypothetical protein NADFUDRAFT_84602, partial [Nadsonia fulvescens var. elongata DSM 6958]
MGTFDGVFIPTTLNVLSILMFLRFGFIIGQTGVLCTLALLVISYCIDLLTTLSISAISTNGVVRGGGAYYMISRSLGPEFGGSIGVVFYIGQVLNSGMNVVGFCEPLLYNFGRDVGVISSLLPVSRWWEFTYATILLVFCTVICMIGSSVFAKTGRFLFWILLLSTLSVPLSTFFVSPFYIPGIDVWYSGLSLQTLKDNLWPRFTSGAAGSLLPLGEPENFQNMFGIFFPATAGIFAGASMSGDLVKPSKSIPRGTLSGLLLTFISYAIVILAMGASIPRTLLYSDVQVLQRVNLSKYVILMGELSTSLFSSIVGIVGSAKLLEAIAKDNIIPGLSIFTSKPSSNPNDPKKDAHQSEPEPYLAIFVTYIIAQITLFFDINAIAGFITMAFLMTFIVTNMACFLLKISSAPNFRPSFRFFSWKTALYGGLFGLVAMFFADGQKAFGMLIVLIVLFILIHYISPPKPWGDVSQGLIYHQVRKYLLRLRQDSVKFWRPQILLLVDDPRSAWNLIRFCNHLKKGGLYILGHVVITDNFQLGFMEIKYQQEKWTKLRDLANAKAFIQIATGPDIIWSIRNLFLGSGLGGMRPNITVLGFFEMKNHEYYSKGKKTSPSPLNSSALPQLSGPKHHSQFNTIIEGSPALPTDDCRKESSLFVTKWVHIIEDLLVMQTNIAVARGFSGLELPISKSDTQPSSKKYHQHEPRRYIDLYPIQMSSQYINEDGAAGDILATNFDTYTLILQMGAILNTVPSWKKSHTLRVIVFVEFEDDVEDERTRIKDLLENLRIKAEVRVECLSSGKFKNYEIIINGLEGDDKNQSVDLYLKNEAWWDDLKMVRKNIRENLQAAATTTTFPTSTNSGVDILKSQFRNNSASNLSLSFIPTNIAETILPSNSFTPASVVLNRSTEGFGSPRKPSTGHFLSSPLAPGSPSTESSTSAEFMAELYPAQSISGTDSNTTGPSLHQVLGVKNRRLSMSQANAANTNKRRHTFSTITGPSTTGLPYVDSDLKKSEDGKNLPPHQVQTSPFSSSQSATGETTALLNPDNGEGNPRNVSDYDSLDKDPYVDRHNPVSQAPIRPPPMGIGHNLQDRFPLIANASCRGSSAASSVLASGATTPTGGMKSSRMKPNFSSLAIPQMKFLENDADDSTKSTITFDDGVKLSKKKLLRKDLKNVDPMSTGALSPHVGLESNERVHPSRRHDIIYDAATLAAASISDDALPQGSNSVAVDEKTNPNKVGFSSVGSSTTSSSASLSLSSLLPKEHVSSNVIDPNPANANDSQLRENGIDLNNFSDYDWQDVSYLSFNDIPAKAQHLILNDLMASTSKLNQTDVIFSTLPAPTIGTHESEEESLEYVESLELWCQNLPPVMLIHSQTMTVT